MDKKDLKSSVRISLNQHMRDAFQFLKKTRYPFMKEDEIFKLAFSRLYANEYDLHEKATSGYKVLMAIREHRPEFGVQWIKQQDLSEKSLSLGEVLEIIHKEL